MKKLAIIGCGGIGEYHLNHILTFDDVEAAGFCDLDLERARAFVDKAGGGKAYTDFKKMYDEVNPDMVFICIPPSQHGEIEFETIRRSIPFFVEKPMALNMDLAREILAAIKEKDLITAVGFQCRYSNLVEPNVKYIRENPVLFLECQRMGGIPGTEWWIKKDLSGGQIVEQTIHQFDIIRYVFDEPVEVFTMATRGFIKDIEGYDTDDLTTTVVRFKSGALGAISTGCYALSGNVSDGKIMFSSRNSRAELKILNELKFYGYGAEVEKEEGEEGFVIKGDGGFTSTGDARFAIKQEGNAGLLCDRTFVDAVITGDKTKIRSPYGDAMKTLEFVLACNESIDTKKAVKIDL